MDLSFPLVNGTYFEFADIEIQVFGLTFMGVKEISYSQELAPGEVYGTHPQKIGRTRGILKPEGSMSLYKEEYDQLTTLLALGGVVGFMESIFDIMVSYQTLTNFQVDILQGCRIKKSDNNHQQGTDPLLVKCDLDIMNILENGKAALTSPLIGI
jgi:hypothetical protein